MDTEVEESAIFLMGMSNNHTSVILVLSMRTVSTTEKVEITIILMIYVFQKKSGACF